MSFLMANAETVRCFVAELDGVEDRLDRVNEDMDNAEGALADLEKCCGLCTLPWKR